MNYGKVIKEERERAKACFEKIHKSFMCNKKISLKLADCHEKKGQEINVVRKKLFISAK